MLTFSLVELPLALKVELGISLARGMVYLHSQDVTHRALRVRVYVLRLQRCYAFRLFCEFSLTHGTAKQYFDRQFEDCRYQSGTYCHISLFTPLEVYL